MERREVGAVGRGDMEGFISAAFFLFRMCVVLLMFFSYTTGAALKNKSRGDSDNHSNSLQSHQGRLLAIQLLKGTKKHHRHPLLQQRLLI